MVEHAAGSDAWWQAKQAQGIPGISGTASGTCCVTFWWRDPAGDESTSDTKRVWIYLTGITDHHKPSAPQSLTRLPGTDAWYWRTELDAAWRGSYCFIPSTKTDDFAPDALQTFRRATRCAKAGAHCCRRPFPTHSTRTTGAVAAAIR